MGLRLCVRGRERVRTRSRQDAGKEESGVYGADSVDEVGWDIGVDPFAESGA